MKKVLRAYFDYNSDGTFTRTKKSNRWPEGLKVRGSLLNNGYRTLYFQGRIHCIHRLIFIWHYGKIRGEIDHRNGIRDDNRIENLRDVTRSENNCNLTKPPKNKTGIKGLRFSKRRNVWIAQISFKYKLYEIYGKNKNLVVKKLKQLRERLHGEFARH